MYVSLHAIELSMRTIDWQTLAIFFINCYKNDCTHSRLLSESVNLHYHHRSNEAAKTCWLFFNVALNTTPSGSGDDLVGGVEGGGYCLIPLGKASARGKAWICMALAMEAKFSGSINWGHFSTIKRLQKCNRWPQSRDKFSNISCPFLFFPPLHDESPPPVYLSLSIVCFFFFLFECAFIIIRCVYFDSYKCQKNW